MSQLSQRTRILWAMIAITACAAQAQIARGCLVCYRPPYQSLLDKVETSEQVIVARTIDETQARWQGKVVRVIKGSNAVVDQTVVVDKSQSDRMSVGDLQLLRQSSFDRSWTIEWPLDQKLIGFLTGGVALSSSGPAVKSVRDQSQILRYHLPYLEHPHPQIADSAYTKIAGASYDVLRTLKADVKADQLLAWIDNEQIAQKRKSLYITLLGICGGQRESILLKQWIDKGWDSQNTNHLAALLTAYAELNGEETIGFIEKSYLQNRNRKLGELIAAITALRVHGQADGTVSRARIQASFHLLLRERPALLEMIIADCSRWEDWSIAPRLMEIHAGGRQPWNNAMIVKYLKACPLPEARRYLQRLPSDTASSVP